MLGPGNTVWTITSEEFAQHRSQFNNLSPTNGFVTGSQVKGFFTASNLPTNILSQIWDLSDFDKDGKLNLHEFSIAMHLIKRYQEGISLPNTLPKEMMVPPNSFVFPDIVECSQSAQVAPSYSSVMAASVNFPSEPRKENLLSQPPLPQRRNINISQSPVIGPSPMTTSSSGTTSTDEWIIMQAVRPRYRLQFNQQDRLRKGYLTGEEAKSVLQRSGLPNNILAHVWSLSDVDGDGKLTCEEFCVAMYLVEQARAGRQLPQTLPDSLVPPSMLGMTNNVSVQSLSNHSLTANDIAPLDWSSGNESRPGTLRATPESPVVMATSTLTNHNHPQSSTFSFNDNRDNSSLFSRSSSQRSQSRHSDFERNQLIESERNRLQIVVEERDKERELLIQLKRRQQALIEALTVEEGKCQEYQSKLVQSRDRVQQHRAEIEGMRGERDKILDSKACLAEQLEAARAEQGRCKRDRDNLQQKHASSASQMHASSAAAVAFTGRTNPFEQDLDQAKQQKQTRQQSIESLEMEIHELEASIKCKTENYKMCHSKLQLLEETLTNQHIPEIERLKCDIQHKCNEVKQLINGQIKHNEESNDTSRLFDDTFDQLAEPQIIQPIKSQQAEYLIRYCAQFAFIGRQQDELKFNTDDIILVKKNSNSPAGWLLGCLETQPDFYGLFPEIYVKQLDEPIVEASTVDAAKAGGGELSVDNNSMHQKSATNEYSLSQDLDNRLNLFDQTLPQGATIKKAAKKDLWVEAIYPWMMDTGDDIEAEDQLKFRIGQRIRVVEKSSDDWWIGEMSKNAGSGDEEEVIVKGWFPQIYVKQVSYDEEDGTNLNPNGNNKYSSLNFAASNDISTALLSSGVISGGSGGNSLGSNGSASEYCVALYPYESSVPGDLTMHAGDIIQLLGQSKSSHQQQLPQQSSGSPWLKGHLRGAKETTGLFPAHYVRRLTSQEVEDAEQLGSTIQSEYYTSLSIEDADMPPLATQQQQSPPIFYSVSPTQEQSSEINPPSISSYSNYCSLADTTSSPAATDSLSTSPLNNTSTLESSQESSRKNNVEMMTASGYDKCMSLLPLEPRKSSTSAGSNASIIEEDSNIPKAPELTHRSSIDSMTTAATTSTAAAPIATGNQDDQPTNNIGEIFIAMYPYNAQNPDELSFTKNSVIRLLSKDEPDWWKGCTLIPITTSNGSPGAAIGQQGLFPVNYVRQPDSQSTQDQSVLAKLGATDLEVATATSVALDDTSGANAYSTVTGRPISWYIDGQISFNALLTEDEKHRQFYIIELIETEKAYYEDLQEVHRVFYEPIKKSNLLQPEQLRHIFLNWSDLIAKSYNFYMALKIRQDIAGYRQPIQCIGDILLSNFPNFIVYVRFCSMQNHAIATLERRKQSDPKFKELCAQCEQLLRCQKMPMTSYFLKPMQRITKYKLLVENVLKYTEEGHPDRGDMEEAVAAARSLCEAVNEGIREKENSERLEWIQDHVSCEAVLPAESILFNSATNSLGHRKLIHCGTLFKAKSGKELVGFLFNDCLLLTIPCYNTNGCPFVFPLETSAGFGSKMHFKLYKKPILLNRVLIMTGIPSNQNSLSVTATTTVFGSVSNNEIFTVREAGSDHVLKALSLNDRDKWVERLVAASLQYIEIENSVREISMSIRRSAGVGRLIVTILEGINLRGSAGSTDSSANKVNAYCEVSLGNQLRRTKVLQATFNPKWHCNMQFLIKNLNLDILCLSVYNKDYFAPNEFLGRTEVAVKDIKSNKQKGPIERKLKLMGVTNGELLVKLDIALFRNDFS